jgi:hypothetical protein
VEYFDFNSINRKQGVYSIVHLQCRGEHRPSSLSSNIQLFR